MQRLIVTLGLLLVLIGLLWPWLARLPFGRLPGDIHFEREGFNFYFPLTAGLVISILISLVLWFFRR
jgi:ribose/xylose/arabinose/galactoside ABC-type transport system permease subunit